MNAVRQAVVAWSSRWWQAWDRFWFTPVEPHALAAIRVLAGAMLFYTHAVWTLGLTAFLGPNSWVPSELSRAMHHETYAWSYLWYIESPAILWAVHMAALVVFALLTIGYCTRVMSIVSAIVTLSYCHRLVGSQFGLDQVNALLAMYLAIGPSGAAYSLDRWLARRRTPAPNSPPTSICANVAVRLIQVHLCVIYLFGGIGKMRGETWWDGSATWFAIANYEYQSIDVTWLVRYPFVMALLTHITVGWETFYPFLVWSRLTRPVALLLAVAIHGGIALFLGMPTFGLAMVIANLAFVEPRFVRAIVRR